MPGNEEKKLLTTYKVRNTERKCSLCDSSTFHQFLDFKQNSRLPVQLIDSPLLLGTGKRWMKNFSIHTLKTYMFKLKIIHYIDTLY